MRKLVRNGFLLIAEPRTIRIMQFVVYVELLIGGVDAVTKPLPEFIRVIGVPLVIVFGAFLAVGGLVGMIAVLPGIWWLERVGLVFLAVAVFIRGCLLIGTGVSLTGFMIFTALVTFLIIRFIFIRKDKLAPTLAPVTG